MGSCLVCGGAIRLGTLCRTHALELSSCDEITAEQVVHEQVEEPKAWLIDQWGSTHPLGRDTVIGRSSRDAGIGVLHPSVSVVHAAIEAGAEGWRVVDRGSLNGTFVNDERVRTGPVSTGDKLRFGDVTFFFSVGSLPSISETGKTGGTQPSRVDDLVVTATLGAPSGPLEMVQRPGGGVIRRTDEILVELARLEFGLLAALVVARAKARDADRSFVSAADLAAGLEFQSRQADGENVRELVRRVRKKLRDAGLGKLIDSQQRVGYRLACEVSRLSSR